MMKLYPSISLQDRVKNAITKLGIDPERVISITDLSRVRLTDDMKYSKIIQYGLIRGFMIDYKEYSHSYYFMCDNGFTIEFKNWFDTEYTPKHHNLYKIMMFYNMGLTQEAIAKALNTSTSTIGNRLKIIKQILEISTIPDMDLKDTIKVIRYDDNSCKIRFSDLSIRLQAIIDKYERR